MGKAVAGGLVGVAAAKFIPTMLPAGLVGSNIMRVIATGGLAEVITRHTQVIQIVAPWLTLDGLRMIYELNQ